jgi:hypothetical protein
MPSAKQLLEQPEYKMPERTRDVQCEINYLEFKGHLVDETRMLIFKISKNVVQEREQKVMIGIEGEIFQGAVKKRRKKVLPPEGTAGSHGSK